MAEQLYIRVRGRVLGPYDQDKLQSLVRRGQLGRLHEVSEDGVSWVRATTYPDLFVATQSDGALAAKAGQKQTETPIHVSEPAPEYAVIAPERTDNVSIRQQWYYTTGGTQCGPVDFGTLQHQMMSGQIGAAELVWTEGMPQWLSPMQIPGLAPSLAPSPTTSLADQQVTFQDSDKAPEDATRALVGSKPWIFFIAIMAFIYAAISLLGGVAFLIEGSKDRVAPAVASGLFGIIFALLMAIGAFLLVIHGNRITRVQHNGSSRDLAAALDASRIFWVYVGILLIIFLAFGVVIGVWLYAIGGTI